MSGRHLRVVAGRQCGARTPLPAGGSLVLGRALDCDVVLREPDMPARLLTLFVDADGDALRLEAHASGLGVDGRPLAAGESLALAPGVPVTSGALALVVDTPDTGTTRAPPADDAVALAARRARGGAPPSPFADVPRDAVSAAGSPRAPHLLVRAGAFAAIACVALAGWFWHARGTVAEGPSLEARLSDAFPALAIERTDRGAVVRGFVPERADAIRLGRWIDAQPERPDNAVYVDTGLAERIDDVFRVNGIEASVRSLVGGEAVVRTAAADPEALARVEALVAEDVPQLVSLALENVPPVAAPEDTPYDPGKRVALVVADAPAYIVTEDRSRYFVGATLPSGHRIAAIEENVVHLVKGGVATELQF